MGKFLVLLGSCTYHVAATLFLDPSAANNLASRVHFSTFPATNCSFGECFPQAGGEESHLELCGTVAGSTPLSPAALCHTPALARGKDGRCPGVRYGEGT